MPTIYFYIIPFLLFHHIFYVFIVLKYDVLHINKFSSESVKSFMVINTLIGYK